MKRFDSIYPLDYRYLPKDEELSSRINEYNNLDILLKLNKIIPEVVVPRLNSLETELLYTARENKNRLIPKRIDGRYDGKITTKKIFTGYAQRLKGRIQDIGKLSLNFDKLEETIRNDGISDLIYFLTSAFSVEANIADDIRHHFRSEINEFSHKYFELERVGSSTMPHKRNPVEYENIKSLWKVYVPRITSAIMNQITEHQGDSTNENLPYNAFELSAILSYATKSLENSLKNLKVNV